MSFSIPSSVEVLLIEKRSLELTLHQNFIISYIKNKKAPPTNCKGAI